ncbi:hypothetical protein ASG90_20475 [Nocardioides sp. Soil797]|nr:hypothetical protein ASG90_20475 [Nocardioides sp. Soil797]
MARIQRQPRDSGQVTVLIVGFAAVLLLMVGVVVDASAAYLRRQSLNTAADGAALAGAQEVRGDGVYSGGLKGERAPLDADKVRGAVSDYLRDIGAYADYPGLGFQVQVNDRAVVVTMSSELDLPINVSGITDGRIGARGSAAIYVEE